MGESAEGRSLLITGGTGTFGQALVRRLLMGAEWDRIVVYSRDEFKQYRMRAQVQDPELRVRYFLGDVRDRNRLRAALRGVHTVVHAAALKQVPLLEYNPDEAVKTNVLGALNLIEGAIDMGVHKVVGLSTDKACAPVNLYGATKLTAEKLFAAANVLSPRAAGGPTFSVVRYGNVTGSRGSVVPVWRQAVEAGVAIRITDPDMTRFWMSTEQAVDFVLRCLSVATGGEVFVPELPAYRVADLAEAVAPGHKQDVIGVRPGEKLHESLVSADEAPTCWRWNGGWALVPEPNQELALEPPAGAERERPGFVLSSNKAREYLGVEELRRRLEEVEE